jgi:hypothetical protein
MLRTALVALVLAAAAHAAESPTTFFMSCSARAAGGSRAHRLAAAMVLADAGRHEQAARFLDGPAASREEHLFRRWLACLIGSAPGELAKDATPLSTTELDLSKATARLEADLPALEALARAHGGAGGLLARGTPEVIPSADTGPALARFWSNDGVASTYAFFGGKLEPARSGDLPVRIEPEGEGVHVYFPPGPGWLFLQMPQYVPGRIGTFHGELVRSTYPALYALRSTGEKPVMLHTFFKSPPTCQPATGLVPEPTGPGVRFLATGAMPTTTGALFDTLPVTISAPDAPLLGHVPGARVLTTSDEGGITVEVSGCPERSALAERIAKQARQNLRGYFRLGAPSPAGHRWRILIADGRHTGFTRGRLVCLVLDPAGAHAETLLSHELAHAALTGGVRGWPGQDPEEGVVDYLSRTKERSRPHDPLFDVPLPRALARARLTSFLLDPPSRRIADQLLFRRLRNIERRLVDRGRDPDDLRRALWSVLTERAGWLTLDGLRDRLEASLGLPLTELRQ